MPSSIIDSDYYKDMFGTAEMRSIFSDQRRIETWLETEVALAKAEARVGLIPAEAAEKIAAAAKFENIDFQAMKAEFDRVGFPIMPLVHQLAKACDPETAKWVHWGSTTQDILDTGVAIQIKEGLDLLERDLRHIVATLTKLAAEHRDTVMVGRTMQQHATPITFGYKVAVWLAELQRHLDRLPGVRERALMGQSGGAVGTIATLGKDGPAVRREMMKELGLVDPPITWHTSRDGWAEAVFWLALVTATLGKIANEVAILMRTEIDELREPYEAGRGASSAMPQKRNPIACQPIIAIAHRLREAVGSQLTAMIQEHERAVGPMHLEWILIPEAFVLTHASIKQSSSILDHLFVNKERMAENLKMGGGFLMSESVMMGLAPHTGRNQAHDIVSVATNRALDSGLTLREGLLAEPEITSHLSEQDIDKLLDPASYTGSAPMMVDVVVKRSEQSGG